MCGIYGFFGPEAARREGAESRLAAMGGLLHHRGPDGQDMWIDEMAGVALGHRRLAILDLSPAGAQPMASQSGRWTIVYNGEIYNHLDLRRALLAPAGGWRGHSDTETLLALIEHLGVERALPRLVGMFAFAAWDAENRQLWLARDRFGEKPLYYGWYGTGPTRGFAFASQLGSLRKGGDFTDQLAISAVSSLLQRGYVAGDQSILADVRRLAPGSWLVADAGGPVREGEYWSASETMRNARANPLGGSLEQSIDALEDLLLDAVSAQMISDVPIGALLSGGIDSSTIVSLMQARSKDQVRTFSIGFGEDEFNEAPYARAVAQHLGTQHHELTVSADDALALIPALPSIYDEPFADSSQIPTILVSRLAREYVTVALSGDAGDELFGGYTSHAITYRSQILGARGRAAAAHFLTAAATAMAKASPIRSAKIARLGRVWAHTDPRDAGLAISDRWFRLPLLVAPSKADLPPLLGGGASNVEELMALDARMYLVDDILVKVDRAAMSASLETRVPMLDHRVFELAWRMPLHHKIQSGHSKVALRGVLTRYVPQALIDRPKAGFSIPLADWLRGPRRDWAEDLLHPATLRADGILGEAAIRQAWSQHLSGMANNASALWRVLMLQAWGAYDPI
ncbi:asparagine synthase (glutamine-hydrolyzing) [Qipengyuania sp. YIM B01966]|uniref:asparagine synthase (glutamine-hydrolyzing) n=1 Tax=Qipengyuania sp. YIM B01966 TaxID=2778646 RepID=UPI0018F7BB48|nr:asparagine synthase (glutamine-hydrolyzing) [Qipengyuania sp. YIM B01966]